MYVYRINPTIPFSGGVALVAANSISEAIATFCKNDYQDYEYDFYECTCNVIVGLDYNTAESKVILDELCYS